MFEQVPTNSYPPYHQIAEVNVAFQFPAFSSQHPSYHVDFTFHVWIFYLDTQFFLDFLLSLIYPSCSTNLKNSREKNHEYCMYFIDKLLNHLYKQWRCILLTNYLIICTTVCRNMLMQCWLLLDNWVWNVACGYIVTKFR